MLPATSVSHTVRHRQGTHAAPAFAAIADSMRSDIRVAVFVKASGVTMAGRERV